MEKFYLELPSKERKNAIIEFINEFVLNNSPTNGCGFLGKISNNYSFERALHNCLNMEHQEFSEKMGKCQSKTFLLIRSNDNKIIGSIQIRWNLTEEMKRFGGNIGYGIRPTERKKGYNKINLYLGLVEAQKLGLIEVLLSCEIDNIGSIKTMQALGGKLKETEIDPYDNILTSVYVFNVEKSIKKYKHIYEPYLLNKINC